MKLPLNKAIQWVKREGEKRHDWKHMKLGGFRGEAIKVVVTLNVMDGFKSINTKGYEFKECVYDLQDGDRDSYSADLIEDKLGNQLIYLMGSGWANCGWFFWEEEFDEETYQPHQQAGHYLVISGTGATKNFLDRCKKNNVPMYEDCIYSPTEELRTVE